MVTVQQIYDMAIHLMDEQSETDGSTVHTDTDEYRFRTISILNSVIPAIYPYSGGYHPGDSGRPAPPPLYVDSYKEPDFGQTIALDEGLCLAVLPYYLAAQLLSVENEELSAWFMNRYRETLMDMRYKVPASFEPIPAPYGLF